MGKCERGTDPTGGLSSPSLASVITSRLININTGDAQQVIAGTGTIYMQVFNVGPTTIAWGDSSITASSGGLLFYSMSEIFSPLSEGFNLYFVADSAQGTILVNELD